jgi:hypothetical protein
VRRLLLLLPALACGEVRVPEGNPGADGGALSLQPCPTVGPGAVHATGTCSVFTPALAGANPAGQNATRLNYALEPPNTPSGALVVLLNGSGGSPGQLVVDPTQNLFNAAGESGHHLLALAYRSDLAVAELCAGRPDCYGPTRNTLLTGSFTPGADASLADIREDEGVVPRLDGALRTLAAAHPGAGWDAFLGRPGASTAAVRIAWERIIAAGHSQGGGHAAYLAKLFPLRRVVQFSSTCDAPGGVPAPWTAADSGWNVSPATAFFGFSASTLFTGSVPTGGDLNCPYHLAVWRNLGMAPSRQADDAATCTGIGPHGASILCSANYPRWVALFR